jgi:SsrA-binding protein
VTTSEDRRGHGRRDRPRRDPAALPKTVLATNRKARHDYAISHVVEAGIELLGSEVKSLRTSTPSLQDGYARVDDGQVWLYGVHVPPLLQASYDNHEPTRKRRCLLHRREIRKLEALVVAQGTTIVPLSLYFRGPRVKVELGVGRGKQYEDKREDLKKRTVEREMRRAVGRRR